MFFIYNGQHTNDISEISFLNRAFRYGDGFFESILYYNNNLPLWPYHYQRLVHSIRFLFDEKVSIPSSDEFKNLIIQLTQKLRFKNARCRITFWRRGAGTYRAIENNYDYIIEAFPLEDKPLNINEIISFGFNSEILKPMIQLSNYKTNSSLYFVLAQKYAQQNNLREVVLLNTANRVCEGSYQNIFIYRNGIFHTPSISEGCIDGSARKFLINYFKENNYECIEGQIEKIVVQEAEMVFFTNGIKLITLGKEDKSGVMTKIMEDLQVKLDIS